MKFIDLHPEFQGMSDSEIVTNIPSNVLGPILFDLSQYYSEQIRMGSIYSYYGYELDDTSDQQQIPCLLPQHGTSDRHPSSRYYSTDRNTGILKPSVFCFKCQKTVSSFWLLYMRESEFHGLRTRELLAFISKYFKVPFPRSILFNFDPLVYYTLEMSETNAKRKRIEYAEYLLSLKKANDPLYLRELKNFLMGG